MNINKYRAIHSYILRANYWDASLTTMCLIVIGIGNAIIEITDNKIESKKLNTWQDKRAGLH